jgi:predicted PurR-regulated permease PerM
MGTATATASALSEGLQTPNHATLKLLAELSIAEIEEQSRDVEHFDRKLGLLVGFALISVAQIVTALFSATTQHSLSSVSHPHVVLVVVVVGLGSVLVAVFAGLFGMFPRTFEEYSIADQLDDYARPIPQVYEQFLKDMKAAIDRNDNVTKEKARLAEIAFRGVVVGLSAYVIAAILVFLPLLGNA